MSNPSSNFNKNSEVPITSAAFIQTKSPLSMLTLSPTAESGSGNFFMDNERNRPFIEKQTDRLPSRQKWRWALILAILFVSLVSLIVSMLNIASYWASDTVSNPANDLIASNSLNYRNSVTGVIVALVLIICCLLGVAVLRRRMIRWECLGHDGKLIIGTLTDVGTRWLGGKSAPYLAYTFVDAENRTYDRIVRPFQNFEVLPTPGMSVYILFLDANNFELM